MRAFKDPAAAARAAVPVEVLLNSHFRDRYYYYVT